MKLKKGNWIYINWKGYDSQKVQFVRFVKMRRGDGNKQSTNKIQTGIIVSSDWLFGSFNIKKPERGCKRGEAKIYPYHRIYKSAKSARKERNGIEISTLK